ncbi:unnamed protein product [Calypogeia fissa]
MDERSETFAWNERCLAEFYRSGEPETTEYEFLFLEVHRPVAIAESKLNAPSSLRGMFLKDSAEPGELLIVSDAVASCPCTRDSYTPYIEGSYVHAPKAAWQPPRPRVPREVQEHLARILRLCIDKGDDDDDFDQAILFMSTTDCCLLSIGSQILDLDSHDPNGGKNDSSSHGNRKSSRQDEPGTSSSKDSTKVDLSRLLWNIVANNGMCTKVRSLSWDEPRQVETCDVWGVWLLPSFINHSCAPNCHRMIVGETIFIRAAVSIAAGEELTLPYFDIFEPLTIRDAHCKTFGFRCECPRCTFERSLGQPYNDIQMQLVKLKIQLQTEWIVNGRAAATSSGEETGKPTMLLKQLADLFLPITKLFVKLAPTEPRKNLFWMKASFIDADIAIYALCSTSSPPSYQSVDHLVAVHGEWANGESEEVKRQLRTITAVRALAKYVWEVHPGNMLGQEFWAIALTATSRLIHSTTKHVDVSEHLAKYLEQLLPHQKEGAEKFYLPYYGPDMYTPQLLGI